jgi:uncharacterized repeat protein (TIGR01451 family)
MTGWVSVRVFRVAAAALAFAMVVGGTAALDVPVPASAAPPAAQGCGYADGSANNGKYAGTICWFDFSSFNLATARTSAGQSMTVTLNGGYTISFDVKVADVAGALPMTINPRATPLETRFAFGTDAYRAVPGKPALYSAGAPAGLKGGVVTLANIKATDPTGAAVSGYSFVAADTEDNVSGESFAWTSDKPINEIERLAPNGSWGCKSPVGMGTTTVSCAGTGAGGSSIAGGKSTALLVAADTPTTFATQWQTRQQSGIAFGIQTTQLTLNKTVADRVNPTDSFDVSVTSPEGATLASQSTGTGATATTGAITVLPRSTGAAYMLTESPTAGSGTLQSNYNESWSCTNATTGSPTTLPSGTGTSKAVAPAIGDNITCTVTNTAKGRSLSLVKHAGMPVDVNGDGLVDAGDTLAYSFRVTNTGQLDLHGIAVSDPKVGSVTCPIDTLTAGASETCTADSSYAITSDDLTAGGVDNSATATGFPPGGTTTITSLPSTTYTPTTAPAPGLSLVKSAYPSDADSYAPGQVIMYYFVVTNTGNVPMNGISVDDSDFTGSDTLSKIDCPSATLAAGAQEVCTATYTLTADDVDAGSLSNSARVTGTPTGSNTTVTSDPSPVTIPETPNPGITLLKSASPNTVSEAGQVVTYSFVVTNSGNITLSEPTVHEADFSGTGGLTDADVHCPETSLAAGQVETCTATYEVTQQDVNTGIVTNSATVYATVPGGETVTSQRADAKVTIERQAHLSLTKRANVQAAELGQVVTYSFEITNDGNVTITNPTPVEGPFTGTGELSPLDCPPNVVLQPGDSTTCTATYEVAQFDVDWGQFTNTARATGTAPAGVTAPVSDESSATVTTSPHAALALVKTASLQQVAKAGQVVTYTFAITNTGNVDITDPIVKEGTFTGHGRLSPVTCPGDSILPPGQSITCTATYTVVAADVADGGTLSNTATASGTPPFGDPVTSDPSTAHVREAPDAVPASGLASTGSDVQAAGATAFWMLVFGLLALVAVWIHRRRID